MKRWHHEDFRCQVKVLYTDRDSVYYGIKGQQEKTQFGRACQELGIRIIYARSPQGKGRVEKWNAIYQDRLVKELMLQGIDRITQANGLLENSFVNELNRKFSVEPASPINYHAPVQHGTPLVKILATCECRKVSNDWVVRWNNRLFQILKQPGIPNHGQYVDVREYLDDSIHVFYGETELKLAEIQSRSHVERQGKAYAQLNDEKYEQIKKLRDKGNTQAAIAKEVNLDIKTVRRYLKAGGVPSPKPRRKRTRVITPYISFMKNWLNERNMKAIEIHKRLVVLGYTGSARTTHAVVRQIKEQLGLQTHKAAAKYNTRESFLQS